MKFLHEETKEVVQPRHQQARLRSEKSMNKGQKSQKTQRKRRKTEIWALGAGSGRLAPGLREESSQGRSGSLELNDSNKGNCLVRVSQMEPQLLNCRHPSPVSVLEPSFQLESCESSFSADVTCTEESRKRRRKEVQGSEPASTRTLRLAVWKNNPAAQQSDRTGHRSYWLWNQIACVCAVRTSPELSQVGDKRHHHNMALSSVATLAGPDGLHMLNEEVSRVGLPPGMHAVERKEVRFRDGLGALISAMDHPREQFMEDAERACQPGPFNARVEVIAPSDLTPHILGVEPVGLFAHGRLEV
ncbi:hypothetical protein Fmac_008465 [Flemingia macrophylla]|uniref:Uncharacterized protein n=1 Tax=Flemingia macrophylla TaxID=520843 RepID=A0ABD1MXH8_9FABA